MKKFLLIGSLFWSFSCALFAQDIQISGAITDALCFGDVNGTINLSVSGGQAPYTYSWSNGSTEEDLSNLAVGNYQVVVTDAIGETATALFTVSEPDLLLGAIDSVEPISCFGGSDGDISVGVYGGTAPYSFMWSTGETIADLSNIAAGDYTLTITDANACTYELNINVNEPLPILLDARVYSCESDFGNDGEVTIMATGGTPPYSYSWSDGMTTNNAIRNDLGYGGYSVTVIDANNCNIIIDNVLVCHSNMVLPNDFFLCKYDEIQLETSAPGAIAYSWSPVNDLSCSDCPSPIASPTSTTTYTVAITSPGLTDFTHEVTITVNENCIWPGDIDSSGNVTHFDLLPIGLSYDQNGPTRYQASINWFGQNALSWQETVPGAGVNLKHVDADGDGTINSVDKTAIELNWEQGLSFSNEVSPYPEIPVLDTLPFYIEVDTFLEGQTLVLPVILGIDDLPGEDIYGIAFSIEYDSSLFVPGSASMTFEESWLGTIDLDMIDVQREFSVPGRFDVALVRTDGNNTSGIGTIGNYIITVEDDILVRHSNESDPHSLLAKEKEVSFTITNVRLINKDGFQINPHLPTQTGILTEKTTGVTEVYSFENQIELFPNPAQNQIVLNAENIKLEKIQLFNAVGILIEEKELGGVSRFTTEVDHLPNGTYWIRLSAPSGWYTGKLVVLK